LPEYEEEQDLTARIGSVTKSHNKDGHKWLSKNAEELSAEIDDVLDRALFESDQEESEF